MGDPFSALVRWFSFPTLRVFDEKCALIRGWIEEGRLAPTDPQQLIFSIWAITQHYADFEAQVRVLIPNEGAGWDAAHAHVETLFRKLLTSPETPS